MRYRIKTMLVTDDTGRRRIVHVAERSVSVFGIILWWWPVMNGAWHSCRRQAVIDVYKDYDLRKELKV